MRSLNDFFDEVVSNGGLSTLDIISAVVPLLEQLATVHVSGQVGPSDPWTKFSEERGVLWFEEREAMFPQLNVAEVSRCQLIYETAVSLVAETVQVSDGERERQELQILDRNSTDRFEQPGFVLGYAAWEQLLDHHDAAVDAFLCGLLLATLALGLDLRSNRDLRRFVTHRQNLFSLRHDLHPVVARAIFQLTELDRNRRAVDLRAVARALTNYRGESVELEFELGSIDGFHNSDPEGKQDTILSRLQQRLFDLSRRNRLLHFREASSTANLTLASVPLTQDIRTIQSDQILTWNAGLHQKLTSGKPILLNDYLNFVEALYLPAVLDRIRSDARRDETEYGFAQLRLVICFLRWSNLKDEPPLRYDSPLLLLPVQLRREKGVQDQFYLEPASGVAEINPAVRYHLNSLYGIELPESIDLNETNVEELYDWLVSQVRRANQGVEIERIERPQVEAVHLRAKKKMEQHRRQARSRGKGFREYGELQYSYDAATYDPLGIKLFLSKVHQENRSSAAPMIDRNAKMVSDGEQSLPRLRGTERDAAINHHLWQFDLCAVTLANFRYRRMSLVRDYEAVIADGLSSPAFDATFSVRPKPVTDQLFAAPSLEERFDILPADPSQAAAIGAARRGDSYIIQGPPGTGKSQTIANLVADFVGRGKRVLFVCEKRAAIDVVYSRLCTHGLRDVCTLIHDALTDKKPFVMELARTYNEFLQETPGDETRQRAAKIRALQHQLEPLVRYGEAMSEAHEDSLSAGQLLERVLALGVPPVEEVDDSLPDSKIWATYSGPLQRLADLLNVIRDAPPSLSAHPLINLSAGILDSASPRQQVQDAIDESLDILTGIQRLSDECRLPVETQLVMANLIVFRNYVRQAAVLASFECLSLSDPRSSLSDEVDQLRRQLVKKQGIVAECEQVNEHWIAPLDRSTAKLASEQLQQLEGTWTRWFSPQWWRLLGTLKRKYRIKGHEIRPLWSQVIARLLEQYEATDDVEVAQNAIVERTGFRHGLDALDQEVSSVVDYLRETPLWLEEFHGELAERQDQRAEFARLEDLAVRVDRWEAMRDKTFAETDWYGCPELIARLRQMEPALNQLSDFMDCLRALRELPAELSSTLRTYPGTMAELEGRLAANSLQRLSQRDREFARFTGEQRNVLADRGMEQVRELLGWNAAMVRGQVRDRFRQRVALSELSKNAVQPDDVELRETYRKGRRILEHEFGKSMRYRAIRDLVSSESGIVVRDLKPVWLMSPLSVADTLPLDESLFDVVIFDEASQVTLESAAPTLFRAPQVIIVGDEMQLPPTSFFESNKDSDEDELSFVEGGEAFDYSLAADSLLNHSARNLASTMLSWHYRSRSESLVSFSNWRFYHGRLLTVPEEQRLLADRQPMVARGVDEMEQLAELSLSRAISFHHLPDGLYEHRRNRKEAEYIADLTRSLLNANEGKTIGIIAFSEAQQDEIEIALRRLGDEDIDFRQRLDAEQEREEDGQFVGLLVKNLENIQGDERDIIILSVCYGPGPDGRMFMNFGPINRSGGEKRLNVAFTRAKHHMMLVSSIEHSRITNEHNDGALCLKNYLRYAAAASVGSQEELELVLKSISVGHSVGVADESEIHSTATSQIADRLRAEGYLCDFSVGQSGFTCDLAIYKEGDEEYRLGLLLDGPGSYQLVDAVEREILRPSLLQNFGWEVERILVKDWWIHPEDVIDRLLSRLTPERKKSFNERP